jgi:hypothetical protein
MTTLPSPFVSGSLRPDVVAELELDEPPLVAEPEVACVVGAFEVFGALAALLAQAASSSAATLAMPTPATRARDRWLI